MLHRNSANLGFVATVNRGMALHPDRDVVLLNSDTEVSGNWLDRLRHAALSGPDIATVTPLSNNATICSYPFNGWADGLPGGLGLERLDHLAAQANAGVVVDVPTGVGFCMYIRRAALDGIGLFDEARFGRGYGEENDFCRRANASGFRNVLCADVFVFHEGGVSFAAERATLQESASQTLLALHPDYAERIRAFEKLDPVAACRLRLDLARIGADASELDEVAAERRAASDVYRQRALDEAVPPYQRHIDELAGLLAGERDAHRTERDGLAETIDGLDAEIGKLRQALSNAEGWVATRMEELALARDELRAAQSLAEHRAEDLARLTDTLLGKAATRWLAWSDERAARRAK